MNFAYNGDVTSNKYKVLVEFKPRPTYLVAE